MKKRIASLILAVLTVCTMIAALTVTASAASGLDEEEIQSLTEDWGEKRTTTDADGKEYTFWVGGDGRFSAMIGDDSITWLHVEAIEDYDRDGTPVYAECWLGISNFIRMDGSPLFEKGSRFSVSFVSKHEKPEEWDKYWNMLDEETRDRLNPKTAMFCDVSVTAPNGTEYHNLGELTELFVSANVMFFEDLYTQIPHVYKMLPASGMECPDPGKYVLFILDHIGEPLVADVSDYWAGSIISDRISPVSVIIIGVAALAVGLAGGFILGRKKKTVADGAKDNEEE